MSKAKNGFLRPMKNSSEIWSPSKNVLYLQSADVLQAVCSNLILGPERA
jgi:hypothetical protein